MKTFADYLADMPDIGHLRGLNVCDADQRVLHHIPAVQGKLGSLKLYYALHQRFDGVLHAEAAEQGLVWFAEHVADARNHAGKHPNIDLLLRVRDEGLVWQLQPLQA